MMAIPAVIAEGEEGGLEAKGKKVADLFQYYIFTLRGTDCSEQGFLKEILRNKFSLTWGGAKFLSMASIVQILKMQLMQTQGATQRCRLSWLTNTALAYEPKCGGGGELPGLSQKMSTAVHMEPTITLEISTYLTYGLAWALLSNAGRQS